MNAAGSPTRRKPVPGYGILAVTNSGTSVGCRV